MVADQLRLEQEREAELDMLYRYKYNLQNLMFTMIILLTKAVIEGDPRPISCPNYFAKSKCKRSR